MLAAVDNATAGGDGTLGSGETRLNERVPSRNAKVNGRIERPVKPKYTAAPRPHRYIGNLKLIRTARVYLDDHLDVTAYLDERSAQVICNCSLDVRFQIVGE